VISLRKLVYGLFLFLIADVQGGVAPKSTEQSLAQFASQRMIENGAVGLSVAVIKEARIHNIFHLGQESVTTKIPVNNLSLFQVGSVSKSVAAWVAMALVRDGKLELDAPVTQYLKRWKIPASKYDTQGITLRRLLSHTAGLRLKGYSGFPEGHALPSLEQSLSGETNGSGSVTLFQQPGKGYSYSGGGYTLLQLLVEEASGLSFSEYAERAVLKPLAMTNSSYEPNGPLRSLRITPHGFTQNTMLQHDFRAQAAASLHTTATDLARFVIANVSGNSVLDKAMVSLMHTPVASVDDGLDIGLGFFISNEGKSVGHGGANFGWRADIRFNPTTGDGLVTMTNYEGGNQLISEVRCFWDSQLNEPLIQTECRNAEMRLKLAEKIRLFIASLMAIFTLVFAWALFSKRVILSLPRSKQKIMGFLLLASVTLLLIAIAYTPLGAYLVAGIMVMYATIDYAPAWIADIVPWICAAMIVAWVPFFCKRTTQ